MGDIRYAWRVLRRSPGFAAIAVLSLALGIGANTAMFGVSWVLFSQPLTVSDPDELVAVTDRLTLPRGPGMRGMWQINGASYRDPATGRSYRANLSFPAYMALRNAAGGAADVFAYSFIRESNISVDGWSMTGAGALASGNYFRGAGAAIALGRALTDDDDRPGASSAVISHRFWATAMGADPAAIGRPIRVNGVPFTIVGVSGPGFVGMSRGGFFPPVDVTIPLHAQPAVTPAWGPTGESLFTSDGVFWIHAMARVKKGTALPPLEAKLTATFAAWLKGSSQPSYQRATDVEVRLLPGGRGVDELSRRARQPVRILTAVVAIVLLLACVNLANLMLARGVARARETSIRLALGSGRLRLVRQAFLESLLLSAAGSALGLWIGVFSGRALLRMFTAGAGPIAMTLSADWRTLAVTAAVACAATVLFGVLPSVRLVRRDITPAMKSAVAVGAGPPRLRSATILMAAQVAVSVPLIAGAAIFLQTMHNLQRVDLGFNPDRLVSFRIDPSLSGYERARVAQTFELTLDRVRAVPGVSAATLVGEPLLAGSSSNTTVTREDGTTADVYFNRIGPDYFATMGIPLIAGRPIDERDRLGAPRVVVINESAARTLFGAASPLGRHFRMFNVETEVAGVARDTKYDSLRKAPPPAIFLAYAQTVTPLTLGAMYVVARTTAAPAALMGALRGVVSDVDRDVPVSRMKTQTEQIQETLGTELAFTRLLVTFGAFALFLACIGLHGLTAYSVARRTSEIGLRIALGAQRGNVLWLILRQAVVVTAIGLAAGIPMTIAGTRAVAAVLYGVRPADPLSLSAAVGLMSAVTALAAYLPAHRAARLDPLTALRAE
ncbi:MAG TPA: ABC transporter permease [Vicinamibacterales bacterium]|jgi:predicted permease|nr:ABC transporter permease [Vicinamibacterales bacterium]